MKPRKLKASEVTFTIETEPDDIPVRGNLIASDDPEYDRQCEDELIERLDRGDYEAWCRVKVTARWKDFEASDYLGGCSLDSEDTAEVVAEEHGMKTNALDSLNAEIARQCKTLAPLTRKAKR